MSLRDLLLDTSLLRREIVDLGDPYGQVEVRELTGTARDQMRDGANEDGTFPAGLWVASLIQASAYDPATGALLFGPADLAALGLLPYRVGDALAAAAMRVSALGGTAAHDAAKNSDAAPSGERGMS